MKLTTCRCCGVKPAIASGRCGGCAADALAAAERRRAADGAAQAWAKNVRRILAK